MVMGEWGGGSMYKGDGLRDEWTVLASRIEAWFPEQARMGRADRRGWKRAEC